MNETRELIKKYNLTANSTPCEICNAMNDLEKIAEGKGIGGIFSKKYNPREPKCYHHGVRGDECLDKDKTLIKLYFLQLVSDYKTAKKEK